MSVDYRIRWSSIHRYASLAALDFIGQLWLLENFLAKFAKEFSGIFLVVMSSNCGGRPPVSLGNRGDESDVSRRTGKCLLTGRIGLSVYRAGLSTLCLGNIGRFLASSGLLSALSGCPIICAFVRVALTGNLEYFVTSILNEK